LTLLLTASVRWTYFIVNPIVDGTCQQPGQLQLDLLVWCAFLVVQHVGSFDGKPHVVPWQSLATSRHVPKLQDSAFIIHRLSCIVRDSLFIWSADSFIATSRHVRNFETLLLLLVDSFVWSKTLLYGPQNLLYGPQTLLYGP
jgi:hypothetical protein